MTAHDDLIPPGIVTHPGCLHNRPRGGHVTVEYIAEWYYLHDGWAVMRRVEDGSSWSRMVATYKTEQRARRVAAYLQAIYDQGEEAGQ